MPKVYEPSAYEKDIYELWENSGAFEPSGSKDYFSIVAPPPNANAPLHIGYGLTMAIEDTLARYHRLQGKAVLFVPGADHAGFETQVVYEKELAKTGKSRLDLSREQLYTQIWDFVAKNRTNFEEQFRDLGASVDWDHFTFSLDEKVVKTVYDTFKKMWNDGLIYRGERLVNFCTHHGTAFADIEVEYKESRGKLYYIRYPITKSSGFITVATTRPETLLGDVAVAVHPDDKRYKKFIGKTVKLPLTNREIPVIADSFVDPKFGTGAVKITPAHDQADFEAAERHDLPKITVIGYDGKITFEAPIAYRNLKVADARTKVVEDLETQGKLVKADDYNNSVGHCYKCGTVIEPLLKEQWFVNMKPLAAKAITALKANKIRFYPSAKKQQLIRYLEELKDWNISRQIAWGIPIPAFVNASEPNDWIYDTRVEKTSLKIKGKTYNRDPDVFDTWFSSSSWPYATLDFPDGKDFKRFYPLSVMETGGEILYPWVSRMIMLGLYETGEVPFKAVYIHGYVMAEDGAKISKSLGNAPDMTKILNNYGSDALRMGILNGRAPAINRGYDARKLEDARNFCNKLWNVARFIESKTTEKQNVSVTPKTIADDWILGKLAAGLKQVQGDMEAYRLSEAYETIYHLVWDDFADWYIEASKSRPNLEVLEQSLEIILKITHPFAPFVTETIWQTLFPKTSTLLINNRWPTAPTYDNKASQRFETIKNIVSEIRSLKTSLGLKDLTIIYSSPDLDIANNQDLIKELAGVGQLINQKSGQGLQLLSTKEQCWLKVDGRVIQKYIKSLDEAKTLQNKSIKRLQDRLKNKAYLQKAPKELVAETTSQLAEAKAQLDKIKAEAKRFEALA